MKPINSKQTRIAMLRDMLGLQQKDFAEIIGISQSALSQLENGKTNLSLPTIQKISDEFNVNCNWLVKGKGNVFYNSIDMLPPNLQHETYINREINGNILIPLIREEAQAGYINGYQDVEFLHKLDVYKIPGFEAGDYRLFEISGDSMTPTIHPREIVVVESVKDWDTIENGTICVVISEKGIVAKRIYFFEEDKNKLILKSDNSDYKTYSIKFEDIYEIWMVKGKITTVFTIPSNHEVERLSKIEEEIKSLREEMNSIKKNQ